TLRFILYTQHNCKQLAQEREPLSGSTRSTRTRELTNEGCPPHSTKFWHLQLNRRCKRQTPQDKYTTVVITGGGGGGRSRPPHLAPPCAIRLPQDSHQPSNKTSPTYLSTYQSNRSGVNRSLSTHLSKSRLRLAPTSLQPQRKRKPWWAQFTYTRRNEGEKKEADVEYLFWSFGT
ncbi:unnamed protein product, partial [Ectocarpus sp. 8 AP-2014]